jgi:thiol-disulfide isomerase/thioredoxin
MKPSSHVLKIVLIVTSLHLAFSAEGQEATVVKFAALAKILDSKSEEVQVINFWATWCAPCIKELPLLEKLNTREDLKANITLVNLDYADKLDRVNAFIKKKNIQSNVLLLDEIDYNSWIDKVDKTWTGAIPATLIINPKTGKRKFVEKQLKEGELETLIAAVQ